MRARLNLIAASLISSQAFANAAGASAPDARVDASLLAACGTCHDAAAASPVPATPSLHGQLAEYLTESIEKLVTGRRPTAVPAHVPAAIDPARAAAIAEHYARQPRRLQGPAPDPEKAYVGRGVYMERCIACHAEGGAESDDKGLGAPLLAGQNVDYLISQTRAYLSGARHYSSDFMRRAFVGEALVLRGILVRRARGVMSDSEIEAVSHFFAAMRPRSPTRRGS